jgi:hypothetical protein
MFRRSRWLLLALILLLPVPSSAGKNNQAAVEGIDVPDVIVKKVKVPKVTAEADSPADVIVKAVKAMKMTAGKVDVDSVDSRDLKIQPIKLEGLEDLPKKIPQDDEDSIDKAVKTAENTQGAADPNESGDQTEHRAMNQAAMAAGQDAQDRGETTDQANQAASEARKRVRNDYKNAADGGALGGSTAGAADAGSEVAPAEAAPEILEPPPKEPSEGGEGQAAEGAPAPAPAVIDVPPEP